MPSAPLLRWFLGVALLLSPAILCGDEKPNPEPEIKFPLPRPSEIGPEKFSALLNAFLQQGKWNEWKQDARPRFTGPYTIKDNGDIESFGIHGPSAVKVYYSPEVWAWMNNGKKGTIADGGMILKALYARDANDPSKYTDELTGFSIMVKDSKGSWDGWFYSDGGPLTMPTHDNAATFFDPNAGFALSCVNCHASADNPEGTYSSLRNVTGTPIEHPTSISPEGLKKKKAAPNDIHNPVATVPAMHQARPESSPWPYTSSAMMLSRGNEPAPLTFASYDHVPQGPRPSGHRPFVTSSNCASCHDATQLYSATPNMVLNDKSKSGKVEAINFSPYSEWRYSMMGLSGRDPVFFAQLESELALHPELSAQIEDKCLGCHAPMGQRQWKHDHGQEALFSKEAALANPGTSHEKYGALARDGVSCVVCHQMRPDGLGDPSTYTGKFKLLEKPSEIFGPYEKAMTLPMEQAMGLTPKHGPHISDSKLCASCHTIKLPALDVGRNYTPQQLANITASLPPLAFHEQTTYLEWKNSRYSTESAENKASEKRSCQDCHTPTTFRAQPLKFRTANIEDDTFPPVDNRARNDQLHLELRDKFSRHALHGINIFSIEMFNQNPWLLGVGRKDNLFPGENVASGFDVALKSAERMATMQTAKVEILKVDRVRNHLAIKVQITNLAGHKFPTGVNFRRAFIELKVQALDQTIWTSGATDKWGVIGTYTKDKFKPLKTEFFLDQAFQPHHQTIFREDQVQIYESLVADSTAEITTSFMGLKALLKDNRILPKGWKQFGPDAELTHPCGTEEDDDYTSGEGKDVISYEVPLGEYARLPVTVTATLYYQSLPPYYLRQRFELADKPEAQKLYYLVNQIDQCNAAIQDWKLKIGQDSKKLE